MTPRHEAFIERKTLREWQACIEEFHVKAKQRYPKVPTVPPPETCELRLDLHAEEAVFELMKAFMRRDIVGIADSIGDALYVVLGTAVECGIDAELVLAEVHRSNMTKFIDGTFREDGKYLKGPSYEKADIEGVISRQSL